MDQVRAPRAQAMAIALATCVFCATAAAAAADLTPQEKALIPLAKKEGAVTIINPQFSDLTANNLGPAFIKRYGLGPEFRFNNLRKGTGQVVSQVRQEIRAGRFTVDVIAVSSPAFFDEAVKHGAFERLDSGYWKNHEELARKSGQYFEYPYVVTPFAYTFQPVWNSACPGMANFRVDSYDDVVQSSLKGKTIASDITKSITYTTTVISLTEHGFDMNAFWDKLKATDPIVEFRTEPKMQMVISCQRPLDMWNLSGRAYQNILKKPELAKIIKFGSYKEGQVLLGNQAAVLKGAPHPNAGKLLIEFLLSKEGTDIMIAGEAMQTFLKNYAIPDVVKPYVLDVSKLKVMGLKDWVGAQDRVKDVRDAWLKRFR
ncbi:MAG: ABC transporter substrate-binding protein [Burkholderiales bacterium]|nr:ABC transporter substrate-binding protein [Burkholderiales bacterium]